MTKCKRDARKQKRMSRAQQTHKRKQLTGWWDSNEHKRFEEGLKLYGKEWKKIAEVVGTRCAVQVRSHAQKFFMKEENRLLYPDSVIPLRCNKKSRKAEQQKSGKTKNKRCIDSERKESTSSTMKTSFLGKRVLPHDVSRSNTEQFLETLYSTKNTGLEYSPVDCDDQDTFSWDELIEAESVLDLHPFIQHPPAINQINTNQTSIQRTGRVYSKVLDYELQIPFDESMLVL
mmetsp:Transcript_2739/g.3107  ORF Transcript_2739/g.3107 Transcript_2739/m.3107 type:complete len:231 (-) Transcript_2739:51-743(-)|eukprot:CAMPEP_0184018380 /NCGR_PEP_ID=MMETSP0954-20121128/8114_1 /TAXON_ID=627963 /ORGANISM="Aplanochytrium sp, Strain PBS07" /LENGTH=230 /DNA_ID=CAMNT_0026299829 /DNA_START=403 /DNA_END=1095 /DNA_ORIENTATION=+